MKTISQRIRAVRVLSWLTQDELARRVGVSRRQVVYWESGSDTPSADRLPKICSILNVPIDWLLTGKGWIHSVVDRQSLAANKQRHLSMTAAHKGLQLPVYHSLPVGPVPLESRVPAAFLPGLPSETNSFIYRVSESELAPSFSAGDLLYLRILNLVYPLDAGMSDPGGLLGTLNGRTLALVLNGVPQFGRAEFTRRSDRLAAAFTSFGQKHRRIVQPEDGVLLQGVVYKYTREV